MSVLNLLSKKNLQLAKGWIPTAMAFGTTAGLGVLYATDWKLVLQYLPIYNTKFRTEE